MKVYFIFNLKKEFINLYNGKDHMLYEILKRIYNIDKNDIKYAYNLFYQMINPIDQKEINETVYKNLKNKIPYTLENNIHNINSTYLDNISKLKINKTYIKLECNKEENEFLNVLSKYDENLFACDFKNQTFFFLNNIKAC